MAVYVNTNYSSLQGQRYLNNATNSLTTTYQRLSSGMRINSAKDDSAGLQIADRMTAQINGLNQGNRNAADGIALAQTMESGMDEISSMLQKMRTLAVQAANGTNTEDDRKAIDKEAKALALEINRIAEQTTFGGQKVLNGDRAGSLFTAASLTLQVGANEGDEIKINTVKAAFSDIEAGGMKATDVDFTGRTEASDMISTLDGAIKFIDEKRADLGAMQNRLESSIRNQSNVSANQADARARIRDADFAQESANLSQQSIIQQAATSMLMQANQRPQLALSMLG